MFSMVAIRWMYLQGSNGEADVENRLGDTVQEAGVGWTENSLETYTLPYVTQQEGISCVTRGAQPISVWQPKGVGDGNGVQKGGNRCIPVTDSCWCMAETNTIL